MSRGGFAGGFKDEEEKKRIDTCHASRKPGEGEERAGEGGAAASRHQAEGDG